MSNQSFQASKRISDDLSKTDPAKAASSISKDATLLVSGFGSVGYPKEIPLALADDPRDLSLSVISGGSTGKEIDSKLIDSGAVTRRFPYQSRSESRNAINSGKISYHDRNVSSVGDEILYGELADPDLAVIEAVAAGDGWLIPTTSIGQTPAFVEAADKLLIEVNHAQPLELQHIHDIYTREPPMERSSIPLRSPDDRIGSAKVEFDSSKLIGIVETSKKDDPYTFRDPTQTDEAISDNLSEFILDVVDSSELYDESVCLQFGVGSLGNALVNALKGTDLGKRDLIYYGEVIQDGLLDLIDDDELVCASATSLALSEEGQTRLFSELDRYTDRIILRPTDISNNSDLINRFGVIAVNSALEVDLYGHVNSTHLNGTQVINGIGGSGDFNRNSLLSITALPSTASSDEISRIVPLAKHVDHTEHDIDVVVTEQGTADLRGLSPRERSQKVIKECAHPKFRSLLEMYIDGGQEGHIKHDFDSAFEWNSK